MHDPSGQLPPSVYWRRRLMAMLGCGFGVLLLIWVVAALLGGSDTPNVHGAADVGSGAARLAALPPASNPPPISGMPRASGTSSATTAPPTIGSGAPASPTTTTTPPPPPGPPQPCPDAAIALTASAGQSSYPAGAHPTFTLHITNSATATCTRDVSRQLRALTVVASNGTVLWSSGDCYSVNTNEVRTLQPGQQLSYSVTWAGRTAAPGCPAGRSTVGAGQYQVIGRLGSLSSPPTTFTLT